MLGVTPNELAERNSYLSGINATLSEKLVSLEVRVLHAHCVFFVILPCVPKPSLAPPLPFPQADNSSLKTAAENLEKTELETAERLASLEAEAEALRAQRAGEGGELASTAAAASGERPKGAIASMLSTAVEKTKEKAAELKEQREREARDRLERQEQAVASPLDGPEAEV